MALQIILWSLPVILSLAGGWLLRKNHLGGAVLLGLTAPTLIAASALTWGEGALDFVCPILNFGTMVLAAVIVGVASSSVGR